ncbi:MAG: peptidylprolyl isomerase [Limisphaerales bacterium]
MTKRISTLCGLGVALALQANAPAQTITNQPQSITVNNASTATFTVGASNALSYQWQFNGTNIHGATNSSLTLEDVMTNQAGSYTVVVNGSVTSAPPAVLTIVPGTIVRLSFSGLLQHMGGSNLDVQLFDHDKPATVQNFLHYIISDAFSNMFFERCVPGFVLQGGSYGASNRTSAIPPITGWDVISLTAGSQFNPPFSPQVASEYGYGPLIKNDFGTVAMALKATPDSAQNGFFFNLADNSPYLNGQEGNFTVFGRILDGTNLLQYFNELSSGTGMVANGGFLDEGTLNTNGLFPTLPVDYTGDSAPANANLVFCDFTFLTPLTVDTNPPLAAITSPATNEVLTNYLLQGTASDEVGLALVRCILTPQGNNGVFPYPYTNAVILTNYASGTTNWSFNLSSVVGPGVYSVNVQAQNGAGYLSTNLPIQLVTNTAILTNGNGTVSFVQGAPTNANPIGYPFQYTNIYEVMATPASNWTFVNWSGGGGASTNADLTFPFEFTVFTATFISNSPNGIAFTSPAPNAMLSNTLFNITGTINTNVLTPPVTVTCQIFTNAATNYAVTQPQTVTGTTNWLVAVASYLHTGSYTIQALATDQMSNNTVISESFNFTADTNLPTVSITSPASNNLFHLGEPMLFQGTASDSVLPLASVSCILAPVANADGTVPYNGEIFTNTAIGTTNWSLDWNTIPDTTADPGTILPGAFTLMVQSQDVAGNVSTAASVPLTISAIRIVGQGTVALVKGTNLMTNVIGYPLGYGDDYEVKATPAAGQDFVDWTYNDYTIANPNLDFGYYGGLLTATFISADTPRGSKGIAFTYPANKARVATNSFRLRGTIAPSVKAAQVTCQISSLTTSAVIGAPLTVIGTNTWSVLVSNLPPDDYYVTAVATNAAGSLSPLSTAISERFSVVDFTGVTGTYSGLFFCTNGPVTLTNSGFLTMTVGASGAFSGRLLFPGYGPASFALAFSPNGSTNFGSQDFHGSPLYLSVSLDLTNGTDTLTGTISSTTWSSDLVCYRAASKLSAHTTPATGKYILGLSPWLWPNTNGYAALSVGNSGVLSLSGALPDGAAFSQSTRISKDGIWPLYAIPAGYKTNGVLMGWETNQAAGVSSGQLYWLKTTNIGAYLTNGIDAMVDSTGTTYNPPAKGGYSIVFQDGTGALLASNNLTMTRTNSGSQFSAGNTSRTDKLAVSLSTSGVLTGHFVSVNSTKSLQFKGAFFGQEEGGSGFILENNGQTGYFLLEPSDAQ